MESLTNICTFHEPSKLRVHFQTPPTAPEEDPLTAHIDGLCSQAIEEEPATEEPQRSTGVTVDLPAQAVNEESIYWIDLIDFV